MLHLRLTRIGKCAGPLYNICKQFDSHSGVITRSGNHSSSHENDFLKIVLQLHDLKALKKLPGRKHETTKPIKGSLVYMPGTPSIKVFLKFFCF